MKPGDENDNTLQLKLLRHDLRGNWPLLKNHFQKSLAKWRNDFFSDLAKLLLAAVCVGFGYLVILYYFDSLWAVFSATPMGEIFATRVSPETVLAINSVLELELSQVAFAGLSNSLLIIVGLGVCLKFSGLYRLTYLNRGYPGVICWGLICSVLSAKFFPIVEAAEFLQGNTFIYLLPTICLLSIGFSLSSRLVPEFTVVWQVRDYLQERSRISRIRGYAPDQEDL